MKLNRLLTAHTELVKKLNTYYVVEVCDNTGEWTETMGHRFDSAESAAAWVNENSIFDGKPIRISQVQCAVTKYVKAYNFIGGSLAVSMNQESAQLLVNDESPERAVAKQKNTETTEKAEPSDPLHSLKQKARGLKDKSETAEIPPATSVTTTHPPQGIAKGNHPPIPAGVKPKAPQTSTAIPVSAVGEPTKPAAKLLKGISEALYAR